VALGQEPSTQAPARTTAPGSSSEPVTVAPSTRAPAPITDPDTVEPRPTKAASPTRLPLSSSTSITGPPMIHGPSWDRRAPGTGLSPRTPFTMSRLARRYSSGVPVSVQ
jgi:hypothetical protein